MNNQVKQIIGAKLLKALEDEKIGKTNAGIMLGINPPYVSMIISEKESTRKGCSLAAWGVVKAWTNSGETLEKYCSLQSKKRETLSEDKPSSPVDKAPVKKKAIKRNVSMNLEAEITDVNFERVGLIKPPLGLLSYSNYANIRITEIIDVVERHMSEEYPIREEWIIEYNKLIEIKNL